MYSSKPRTEHSTYKVKRGEQKERVSKVAGSPPCESIPSLITLPKLAAYRERHPHKDTLKAQGEKHFHRDALKLNEEITEKF